MEQAATYCRSSKDRADVSLDAQSRELKALAKARRLAIVETFQDVVVSGKDDQRPGFQALLRRLKDPARTWTYLLAIDTSRIARNQYLAHALHYECEKRGIKVLYAKVPETGSAMDVVIRAVMQSFDQLHSMMSREKGLAGMAENVKQGWRAGGRAPFGYKLEHIATGAVRDGEPVRKSRLVPSNDAAAVRRYLSARAAGVSRAEAARAAGMKQTASSLIGLEWNSLCYGGHTVWGVHAERIPGGGYKGGEKRRPRSEWLIQHDTHKALISTEEAEAIIAKLDAGRPKRTRKSGDYLLSGILVGPDGMAWHGSGVGYYRIANKGRRVNQEAFERALVDQVSRDLLAPEFVAELAREARRMSAPPPDGELRALREKVQALSIKADKLAALASESETPRPFLAQIKVVEREREAASKELDALEELERESSMLGTISEREVRKLLSGLAGHMAQAERGALKDLLAGIIDKIELDPATMQARIFYRISAANALASPRLSPRISQIQIMRLLAA